MSPADSNSVIGQPPEHNLHCFEHSLSLGLPPLLVQGQIIDASVVSQDPEMQSAKPKRGSGHKAVQFFGDISKSW
jgi:hypothetical protein